MGSLNVEQSRTEAEEEAEGEEEEAEEEAEVEAVAEAAVVEVGQVPAMGPVAAQAMVLVVG